MRWDRLFDDLEAQLDSAQRDEFEAEVRDRTRRELARVSLLDRLRQATGMTLEFSVDGAGTLHGSVRRVGAGWLLLDVGDRPDVVVNTAAVIAVRGLPRTATTTVGAIDARLDLGHVLRAVARDRCPVAIVLRDATTCNATIDRVGADFVEAAEHAVGEARRPAQVTAVRAVAFAAIALVRPA